MHKSIHRILVVCSLSSGLCFGAQLVNPSITPPGGGGGGPTNGQTAAQVATQISGTNNTIIIPQTTNAFNAALTGVISTNGANMTTKFTATGTNNITTFIGTAIGNGTFINPVFGGTLDITAVNADIFSDRGGGVTVNGNWTFSAAPTMSAAKITAGTLNKSAADTSWMPITNAIAWTNSAGLPTAGQALVFTGNTNTYGAYLVIPTNWPSGGGSVPNNLVTNAGTVFVTVSNNLGFAFTNGILLDTNTVNGQSLVLSTNAGLHIYTNGVQIIGINTNGVSVNTGISNYFGGINNLQSNAAPYTIVTSSGLHTVALNQGWTNDMGRRANLIISVAVTNLGFFGNKLVFTNTVTGECYTNMDAWYPNTNLFRLVYTDISPGDYGSFSNYVLGGSTTGIMDVRWKLK